MRTATGANIDVAKGGSITIRVAGTVVPAAASEVSFNNTATVQWTSLDGTVGGAANPVGERTGVDGPLGSGVLNDYRATSTLTVPVAQAVIVSRVGGLSDTPAASPTNAPDESVTVGEVVRYRVVALLSEGATNDYSLQVTLQNGLGFINDGTTRIVFISNDGVTTDITNLITSGVLNVAGNQTSAQAVPITPDLSGAAPTGVLNPADIAVTTDANGNSIITFHLGNLVNQDNDADLEGVSLEFNARVLNQASNLSGARLTATAVDRSGTTNLSTAQTVREDIVEPTFTGMAKQVYSFNPTSATAGLGTADVDISFTQSGTSPAYDVVLTDNFPTASNYAFDHLVINGTSFTAAQLAGIGVTVDVANGLRVTFDKLDAGSQVSVFYSANAPDGAPIATTNATLTWTSLPDSFTTWGGSAVGVAGAADGERTGSGVAPDTYVRTAGAGLGVISGTLWDDTASATASATPDGPGLAVQPVTLTWAGVDGNLATTADNLVYTTTTDANGQYHFGVLPLGTYQIQAPTGTLSYPQPVGTLAIRIDSDAATPLGTVGITLANGGTASANAGYVEQNDAPVNHLPATAPSGTGRHHVRRRRRHDQRRRRGQRHAPGDALRAARHAVAFEPAVGRNRDRREHRRAHADRQPDRPECRARQPALSRPGELQRRRHAHDQHERSRQLRRSRRQRCIPGQLSDALTAVDTLPITVIAVNDAPVAVNDTASATEAGGTLNSQVGVDPTGNVLSNDTDVDIATNGDALRVVSVTNQNGATLVPAEHRRDLDRGALRHADARRHRRLSVHGG